MGRGSHVGPTRLPAKLDHPPNLRRAFIADDLLENLIYLSLHRYSSLPLTEMLSTEMLFKVHPHVPMWRRGLDSLPLNPPELRPAALRATHVHHRRVGGHGLRRVLCSVL